MEFNKKLTKVERLDRKEINFFREAIFKHLDIVKNVALLVTAENALKLYANFESILE